VKVNPTKDFERKRYRRVATEICATNVCVNLVLILNWVAFPSSKSRLDGSLCHICVDHPREHYGEYRGESGKPEQDYLSNG
jgi:hypothetical protein